MSGGRRKRAAAPMANRIGRYFRGARTTAMNITTMTASLSNDTSAHLPNVPSLGNASHNAPSTTPTREQIPCQTSTESFDPVKKVMTNPVKNVLSLRGERDYKPARL
ncbi:MAG: hypothetical protein FD138_2226 [Planctomycetota bacterium]|nr:MAG: hypothetical protein FD138_2226 [Planctomycetota bacterium]